MANSVFQKNKALMSPVSVPNGGTGRTSLDDKSVLIGAGTGNVSMTPPGTSGNGLISDGTSFVSGPVAPGDGSVTYVKLGSDLTGKVTSSTENIDWSSSSIFMKTLTSNTTLTFSNYQLSKTIVLIIQGNYILKFPTSVKYITGTYNGKRINYVTLQCIKSTASQEVLASISQKTPPIYAGYFAGGSTNGAVATTDKIIFSTGATSASTVSNISQARYNMGSVSDGLTYGYFGGGDSGGNVATTDRIVFATDVSSANTISNLSGVNRGLTGISDGGTYGYFAGGIYGTTDRIVFSTGVTSANTVSNVSVSRYYVGGVSDALSYGYVAGGTNGTYMTTTDRITFSTGVAAANTVSNLSVAKGYFGTSSDSLVYGYFAGGYTSSASIATTDRITFSTGATAANTVSNLSVGRFGSGGNSDSFTYGYFAGGYVSSNPGVVTADRIVFSTGATSANTVSNLSQARHSVTGISNCSV